MKLSDVVLDSIDWSAFAVLRGKGADLKQGIKAFLGSETPARAAELWWGLEGSAFAQNTIYGAAEPTVEVMLAALVDGPADFLRAWIIEVLRFILSGASQDDPELAVRCRDAAKRGAWLLVAEARRTAGEDDRRAILDVLDQVDQGLSSMARSTLGSPS